MWEELPLPWWLLIGFSGASRLLLGLLIREVIWWRQGVFREEAV
jgi:hypothetical protein